jgi:hypothetical protein
MALLALFKCLKLLAIFPEDLQWWRRGLFSLAVLAKNQWCSNLKSLDFQQNPNGAGYFGRI